MNNPVIKISNWHFLWLRKPSYWFTYTFTTLKSRQIIWKIVQTYCEIRRKAVKPVASNSIIKKFSHDYGKKQSSLCPVNCKSTKTSSNSMVARTVRRLDYLPLGFHLFELTSQGSRGFRTWPLHDSSSPKQKLSWIYYPINYKVQYRLSATTARSQLLLTWP